jgi:outer membrane receptor for ferrienterochelin and colicins
VTVDLAAKSEVSGGLEPGAVAARDSPLTFALRSDETIVGRFICLAVCLSCAVICRAQESSAEMPDAATKPEAVLFDPLPVVEGASLHTQSLMEAPASVTVITDEDIRRRGYRTVDEALADVRGFYITSDRAYSYLGVRGFSIPGDENTRLLVLVDGHSITENIYGSSGLLAQDFGVDLDLILRIEIIRGPSSALYGSNGMFATINIVTKSPAESRPLRASVETGSFGERKLEVSTSRYLGGGVNLLISASVFNDDGPSLYFPEFDSAATNYGRASGADGERGYHAFANLIWRNWSFIGTVGDRLQNVPTAWYGTVFNDSGTWVQDERGFVEAAYQRDLPGDRQIRWRTYYDQYRSENRFDFQGDNPFALAFDPSAAGVYAVDARNGANGDWLGSQLTDRFRVPHLGFLTIGGEGTWDLRASQFGREVWPTRQDLLVVNRLDRKAAAFFQQEVELSSRWKLYLGGRLDGSRYHGVSFSPRFAVIYQPSPSVAWKLLYGNAFRNPSQFEEFYADGVSRVGNPSLRPEHLESWEGIYERQLAKRFTVLGNAYYYDLDHWIIAAPVGDGLTQFQNTSSISAAGIEVEATAEITKRVRADASLAVQNLLNPSSGTSVNSPARVGKFLLDAPLFRDRFSASAALQYLSARRTLAGNSVGSEYLVNLSLASRGLLPAGFEAQFGIRNLLNWHYSDPAEVPQMMDTVPQDGRSFFVRISWARSPEEKEPGTKQAPGTASGAVRP